MTKGKKNTVLLITFIGVLLVAITVWALSDVSGQEIEADLEQTISQTNIPEKMITEDDDLHEMFRHADVIPDGKLDAGEFDIYHYNVFHIMDVNKDGRLVKDECMTDCFNYNAWTGKRKEKGNPYRVREFGTTPERYEAIDIDGSGDLVVYEYILFGRERFPHFDHNKDNFIQNLEFCSGYKSSLPCDFNNKEIFQ